MKTENELKKIRELLKYGIENGLFSDFFDFYETHDLLNSLERIAEALERIADTLESKRERI